MLDEVHERLDGGARRTNFAMGPHGHGRNSTIGTDSIHLAWMPLRPGVGPVRQQLRYYTGVGEDG
jgi:hypothetical protein